VLLRFLKPDSSPRREATDYKRAQQAYKLASY
jgi:hypothetical protein